MTWYLDDDEELFPDEEILDLLDEITKDLDEKERNKNSQTKAISLKKEVKCTCGSEKCGSPKHSHYCDIEIAKRE